MPSRIAASPNGKQPISAGNPMIPRTSEAIAGVDTPAAVAGRWPGSGGRALGSRQPQRGQKRGGSPPRGVSGSPQLPQFCRFVATVSPSALHLLDNLDTRGHSQAIGPGFDHRQGRLEIADAAGGLDLERGGVFAEQRHVLDRRTAGRVEAG